jgi:hypothetical protein
MQIKFYLKHEKMVNMIQLVSKGKKQGQTLNYFETILLIDEYPILIINYQILIYVY